ncbi:MAG: arylamine N-acetyltransferase [Sphingomonadaceae bacterium]
MTAAFDIPAYLARIGLAEQPAPDLAGLIAIQRAHRLAIPFENLDIRLGRGIDLDPDHVFDKLVLRRRGGYCFEQNGLFLSALLAMGFAARPLLARVWLFAADAPPKTHMLILVTLNGEEWIADAGFGGSYTPPMPLAEQEMQSPDGTRHRLLRDGEFGWMLERQAGQGEWSGQYSFSTARVWPSDIALANHFTATAPGSRFVENAVASVALPTGFASLFNRSYSRTSAKGEEAAEITSAKMLQLRLSLVFGIDLSNEEVARLGLF